MDSQATTPDFSYLEDVNINLPMLRRYTLLSLFFHLGITYDSKEIIRTLQQGLNALSKAIPHLKGRVIFEKHSEQDSGHGRIIPFDNTIVLVPKDVRDSASYRSFETFRNAEYPFSMLDPHQLVPEAVLPYNYTAEVPYEDTEDRPARVLVVQATFLKGGLVLTFCSCHPTMDMNGLGQVICLFAKVCRGESFTDQEISNANQDRRKAIPLLGADYQPGDEAKYFMYNPKEDRKADGPSSSSSPARWAYIKFEADSVTRIKSEASQQDMVPYVTTNDALSAFFWQHITKARVPRLGINIESELNRQISARRLLGLNDGYQGHMTGSAHTHEVDIWKQSLGHASGRLRQTLQDSQTLKFHVQAMATMADRAEDKGFIVYGASLAQDRDVILSSYAEIQVCQVSFGPLLGYAEVARRPRANVAPSLVYLMPKDRDGTMVAAVCLREDDWERMCADEDFCRFAKYIG